MKNAALLLVSILASLVMVDVALRLFDIYPFEQPHVLHKNEPQLHDADPVLGWTLRPGRHVWRQSARGLGNLAITVKPDRSRVTRPNGPVRGQGVLPGVAVVGGSWMFGFGLSDEQTFAWKLQDRLPGRRVLNLAVTGYGAYQSWLALKRRIDGGKDNIGVVLYGLIHAHALRNVADYSWLKSMYFVNANRNQGALSFPYVTLTGDGALRQHAPDGYTLSAAAVRFPVWRLVEDFAQRLTHDRKDIAQAATLRLLGEMDAYLKERNIRFVALYIDHGDRTLETYARYFDARAIRYLDLRLPPGTYGDWRLPFDRYGHLGEAAQTYWVDGVMKAGIFTAPERLQKNVEGRNSVSFP